MPDCSKYSLEDLVADLKPTSPLRQRDGMMGATLALALGSALVVAVLGIRRDFASAHPEPLVLTAMGLFLLLTFASAWAAVEMAQPEVNAHRDGRAWAALMAAILPGSALAFMAMKLNCGYPTGLDVRGYSCLALGCGVGLLTAAALIAWLRRGAPTSPSRAGLLSGVAAGAAGIFAVSLWCPQDSLPHIGIWHGMTVIVMGLQGRIVLPHLLTW